MKKEIYGKKLVKYPKHVADMELSIESFVRQGIEKIQIHVDENYNLTWSGI